jgi:hypothetical protein
MVGRRQSLDGGASVVAVAGAREPRLDQMQVTAAVLDDTVLSLEEC